VLRHFEEHWENNEEAGDYRLVLNAAGGGSGMQQLVDALVQDLRHGGGPAAESSNDCYINMELKCQWRVQSIRQHTSKETEKQHQGAVEITSSLPLESTPLVLHADCAVVTVPPPSLQEFDRRTPFLTEPQRTALDYIGFARAIKVICHFSQRLWPAALQSVVVAAEESDGDMPIPELWFREYRAKTISEEEGDGMRYVMVGFLTSQAADDFVEKINSSTQSDDNNNSSSASSREEAAAAIAIQQLARILSNGDGDDGADGARQQQQQQRLADRATASLLHCTVFDWCDDCPDVRGGYMYPRTGLPVQPHLHALANHNRRILLAGEATNTNACCTIQAAMETGIRAADQVVAILQRLDHCDNDGDDFGHATAAARKL